MQLKLGMRKEEVPPGTHLLHLYNKPDEVVQIVIELFGSAVEVKSRSLYVGSSAMIESLTTALDEVGLPVDKLRSSGQMIMTDQRDAYVQDNRFDPYRLVATHMSFITQSQREGWRGVHAVLDMGYLADNVASNAQILKYEAMCDAVFTFQNTPIIAVAQYSLARMGPDMQVELNKLHPLSLVGRQSRRNPQYVNSEQYFKNILKATRKHAEARG